jgi:hypothetical protein
MLEFVSGVENRNQNETAYRTDYAKARALIDNLRYGNAQDMKAVVDQIVAETNEGLAL